MYIYTYIRTHARTHVHTYIHTYIHVLYILTRSRFARRVKHARVGRSGFCSRCISLFLRNVSLAEWLSWRLGIGGKSAP